MLIEQVVGFLRMMTAISVALGAIAGCRLQEGGEERPSSNFDAGTIERAIQVVLLDPPTERNQNAPPFAQLERRVQLRNDDEAAIELRVLGKSCGCLQYDLTPSIVEPGSTAMVVISVRTNMDSHGGGNVTIGGRKVPGEHSSNDADGFEDSWEVVATVGLSFTSDIDFDFVPDREFRVTVLPDEPFDVTFHLRRLRPSNTVVASGHADLPGLVVEPGAVDPGGHFQPVRVHGRGGDPGVLRGWVYLQLENAPVELHAIPIRVQTTEPDRALPSACIVSPEAQGRVSQRVELRTFNRDPVSLRVEPHASGAVAISQPQTNPDEERSFFVDIDVSVDDLPGPHGRAWIDVLDHDGEQIFRFPVLWFRPS